MFICCNEAEGILDSNSSRSKGLAAGNTVHLEGMSRKSSWEDSLGPDERPEFLAKQPSLTQ